MHPFEKNRKHHRPNIVKILYIAESRPDGGTFFYNYDSKLFSALKTAWENALGKALTTQDFINLFIDTGCYLEDLCLEPVNKLPDEERKQKRKAAIPHLASRIKQHNPKAAIILMKGIYSNVQEAIRLSGCHIEYIQSTSFPAHSIENETNCIEGNASILKELIKSNLLIVPQ